MEITLLNQVQVFVCALIFGIILGFLYTCLKVLKEILGTNSIQNFFYDIAYFIICAFLTFIFVFTFNYGEVRFFLLVGELCGFIIYYITIGNLIAKAISVVIYYLKKIKNKIKKIIITPVGEKIKKFSEKLTSKIPHKQINLNNSKLSLKNKLELVYNSIKDTKFKSEHKSGGIR